MSSAATPKVPYLEQEEDQESGYSSASGSEELPEIYFTRPHLKHINAQLAKLEPIDVLKWALITFPNLYQTTAFGLTGLVTLDMLSKLGEQSTKLSNHPVPLIFLDTLFHFPETLQLVENIKLRYPSAKVHVFKPNGFETAEQFNQVHGENLWEVNDNLYDYIAKVEPAQRAYADLKVRAVLTGRRKSQGGKRGSLAIVEIDEAGLIKVNPMANWSFPQVKEYIDKHEVPYNVLLDRGYKSVGDWHSTSPVKEGEDERSGRWKGTQKTECGIHNPRSKYGLYLKQLEMKKQEVKQRALEDALQNATVSSASA